MPTYDFRCPNGHVFERFFKMSEVPSALPCAECGAEAERRISGGAGLMFKGSGFYLTDYGKNAHRGTPASDAKPAAGEGAKGDAKPESKGESKPAATPAPAKPSTSE